MKDLQDFFFLLNKTTNIQPWEVVEIKVLCQFGNKMAKESVPPLITRREIW